MITIKDFPVKNQMSEMTLLDFYSTSSILGNEDEQMTTRYLKVLEYLGCPKEIVDLVTIDDLIEFVQNFCKETFEKSEVPRSMVIEGAVYKIYDGEEFIMGAKDLAQIEKSVKKEGALNIIKALSIILKREGVVSHYEEEHLKNKEEILSKQPIVPFLPLIIALTINVGQKIVKLNAANSFI